MIAPRRGLRAVVALAVSACAVSPGAGGPEAGRQEAHRMNAAREYPVIPFPSRLTPRAGVFRLGPRTVVGVSDTGDGELLDLADYAVRVLGEETDARLEVVDRPVEGDEDDVIALLLVGEADEGADPEGYRLEVTDGSVTLSASGHAGLFYGVQTLRQLVLPGERGGDASGGPTIPAVLIEDEPRFAHRGMHLDVARHFFPVPFIKKYIDLLATYKMNTFHWHLTDDQGWRIEIQAYPRLTEVGAYRKETILGQNFDPYVGDGKPYGGFYTREEVREVVAYAHRRHVTVIPEIEMPGHATAALAAYPELACTDGPFEVATVWGVHEDIFCPSEATFRFLENVLAEVMELFPGRYIHIGGDEAPKLRWRESDLAQRVMRREGLEDEEELQSWFIRRIGRFLRAHGRDLIGWDEILEGGLAPGATVMSWRGMEGGIEAARQGHDVIMTPTSHVYFDYYQGDPGHEPLAIGGLTPLEEVYGFEPVPEDLGRDEARHVLGAQGNVWTEYMRTGDYVEYMVIPRMLALAEVVWSEEGTRDWDRFTSALPSHLRRLGRLGYVYRLPHPRGLERDGLTLDDRVTVRLRSILPGSVIRYTTDGTDPGPRSHLYDGPMELPVDEAGVRVTARAYLDDGRASPPRSARFARTELRPALDMAPEELAPGLLYRYREGSFSSVEEPGGAPLDHAGVVSDVELPAPRGDEAFAVELHGYLRAPASGVYTFHLTSDDGSDLRIGDVRVVDNDGLHGPVSRTGQVALEAGFHPISVRYFQAGGGRALELEVSVEGADERRPVNEWLFHRR